MDEVCSKYYLACIGKFFWEMIWTTAKKKKTLSPMLSVVLAQWYELDMLTSESVTWTPLLSSLPTFSGLQQSASKTDSFKIGAPLSQCVHEFVWGFSPRLSVSISGAGTLLRSLDSFGQCIASTSTEMTFLQNCSCAHRGSKYCLD